MRITVVAIGRLRAPYSDDVAHYKKLLSRYARLELTYLKDEQNVVKSVPPNAYLCLLDSGGKSFTSVEFSRFLEERRGSGRDLCFLLGGPRGIASDLAGRVDLTISFGSQTLPHQLAQVVLLEQLYRAHKIIAGEPYHY